MLLSDVAACHRLTRLVTSDSLTQPWRDRLIEAAYVSVGRAEHVSAMARDAGVLMTQEGDWQMAVDLDPVPPKLADLITCRWCASIWVALGMVVVRRFRWWPTVRDALALSTGAALLARLEGD